jgi:hypothetical protein
VVLQIERILAKLARDSGLLERLRQQGMRYARECLSWDQKAQLVTQVLRWAVRRGPKPDLQPPKALCSQNRPPTFLRAVPPIARATGCPVVSGNRS